MFFLVTIRYLNPYALFLLFYSAGGLVTAVAPVVIDCDGLWVGWTGLDNFNTGYSLSESLIFGIY